MNSNSIMEVTQYDRIDGINAYGSHIKKLSLGLPRIEKNKHAKIAAQVWEEDMGGELVLATELPMHQLLDLTIFLSRTLLYFQDAYRLPLLYDAQNPLVDRIGIQGDAMSIAICMENPEITADIQAFSHALNELGEISGERLRVLSRLLKEMGY